MPCGQASHPVIERRTYYPQCIFMLQQEAETVKEILTQKEKCYLRDICSIHLCGNWTNPTYLEGGLPENDLVTTNLSWPDSAYWSCIFSVGYWNQLFCGKKSSQKTFFLEATRINPCSYMQMLEHTSKKG